MAQSIHDLPVNILIGMHGDIPEADRGLHLARKCFIDDCEFGQCVKEPAHCFRNRKRGIRNANSRDVDANLYSSCEVERDDVLKIRIRRELRHFFGIPTADSLDTASQGFELLVDQFPIHFLRLSARIRFR